MYVLLRQAENFAYLTRSPGCERGGSLETKPGVKFGFSSRSLKGVHFLRQAGYRNVTHLAGGVYGWRRAGLPIEGDEA